MPDTFTVALFNRGLHDHTNGVQITDVPDTSSQGALAWRGGWLAAEAEKQRRDEPQVQRGLHELSQRLALTLRETASGPSAADCI